MEENETPVESGGEPEQTSEEVQREARDMGWMPKENWKGKPEVWVDAEEFVKKGRTFVPFLQHDRKKLKAELDQERQARQRLEQELQATRASVEEVKEFNKEMAEERQSRRKVEIGQELRAAREAGDDVKVAELQAELGEVIRKPEPAAKPNGAVAPQQPQVQPWVKEFLDGNADFFQSTRKVALFNAVLLERRQNGDTRVGPAEGTALLREVTEEVEKALGGNPRRRAESKTEESRSAGGGRSSAGGGQSYADLPPEAQQKCNSQEAKFVGPKKAFKDSAAWRKHYAAEYFGPSAITMRRE